MNPHENTQPQSNLSQDVLNHTAELNQRITSLENSLSELSAYRLSTVNPSLPLAEPIGYPEGFSTSTPKHTHYCDFKEKPNYTNYAIQDKYPIPALEDREYYFPDQDYDYWISGLTDYLRIKERLEEEGFVYADDAVAFDFGCSSGRVLRHFASYNEKVRLIAADLNANHVNWVNRYLPQFITCFQCINLPALPLPDATFDLVYAFSVFTHIDELESAWLLELNRIMKPGAYAWLSIQSDDTWKQIGNEEHFMFQHLKYNEPHMQGVVISEDLFSRGMPQDRYIFRFNNGVVYNTCVFHKKEYIEKSWGKIFDVLDIITRGHDWQDVVLLRKRG